MDEPKARKDEIKNLEKIKEYHGEAKTQHDQPIVFVEKKSGVHITNLKTLGKMQRGKMKKTKS
jgi:hypothetical protein